MTCRQLLTPPGTHRYWRGSRHSAPFINMLPDVAASAAHGAAAALRLHRARTTFHVDPH